MMPLPPEEIAERQMLRRIRADIKKSGQSVVYIGDAVPAFHYTVGRTSRRLPELLLAAGIAPEMGMHLLNALDRAMPEAVPSGSRVSIGGPYPVLVLDVVDPIVPQEYTCAVSGIYGDDYRVQQIVCCDRQGRFPPNCDPPFSRQRLFGAHVLH